MRGKPILGTCYCCCCCCWCCYCGCCNDY